MDDERLVRHDAELARKVRKEAYENIIQLIIIGIVVIVLPLAALAYHFYAESSKRIDCDGLAKSSIRYLNDVGENLPKECW